VDLRQEIESLYERHVAQFSDHEGFRSLEEGRTSEEDQDRFLSNVVRTHLKSPQIIAFLYSLAPPASADSLLHNMLEELGIDDSEGVSHPSLLRQLAEGAGLAPMLPELERLAEWDLRRITVDPLLYETLSEFGFAALCEVTAFEFMLSRLSSRIAGAFSQHRGLDDKTLLWFTHHSEVDIGHAEQGLDNLVHYAHYYDFDGAHTLTIVEMVMRENVFIKRYLGISGATSE
jgi:pyrroloquinoline quinone (PQQ) biosynthesis protein C